MATCLLSRRHVAGMAGTAALLSGVLIPAIAAGDSTVSFERDVRPILQTRCVECHQPDGIGYKNSGLDLRSYEGVMQGTKYGPVVVPGDIYTSNLLLVMMGQVSPEIRMPFHREQVPVRESTTVMRWVQQGAQNN